jgi:hypothetical protein
MPEEFPSERDTTSPTNVGAGVGAAGTANMGNPSGGAGASGDGSVGESPGGAYGPPPSPEPVVDAPPLDAPPVADAGVDAATSNDTVTDTTP